MISAYVVQHGINELGFYPALVYLKEQQDLENYENCKVLKQELDKVCKGREWYLDTKIEDKDLYNTYCNIVNSSKSNYHQENMPRLIQEFEALMNQ